jgi:hypothetical protein
MQCVCICSPYALHYERFSAVHMAHRDGAMLSNAYTYHIDIFKVSLCELLVMHFAASATLCAYKP